MHHQSLSDREIEQLAQKRAAARLGWCVHATVYLLVNMALAAAATLRGHPVPSAPMLGWGVALCLHGAAVLLAAPRARLYQHLLQQERQRLQPQRDPW